MNGTRAHSPPPSLSSSSTYLFCVVDYCIPVIATPPSIYIYYSPSQFNSPLSTVSVMQQIFSYISHSKESERETFPGFECQPLFYEIKNCVKPCFTLTHLIDFKNDQDFFFCQNRYQVVILIDRCHWRAARRKNTKKTKEFQPKQKFNGNTCN